MGSLQLRLDQLIERVAVTEQLIERVAALEQDNEELEERVVELQAQAQAQDQEWREWRAWQWQRSGWNDARGGDVHGAQGGDRRT